MNDLDRLMETDPLQLTREDARKVAEILREQRAKFMLGLKAPKEPKPDKKEKIDLGEIGL